MRIGLALVLCAVSARQALAQQTALATSTPATTSAPPVPAQASGAKEEVSPYDRVWNGFTRIYRNDKHPIVQQVLFTGRFQHDFAAGEVQWLATVGRRRVHIGPGPRFPLSLMGDIPALAVLRSDGLAVRDAVIAGTTVNVTLTDGPSTIPLLGSGSGGIGVFDITDPFAWQPMYRIQTGMGGVHNFAFHPAADVGYVWTGALPGVIDSIPIIDFRDLDNPEVLPGPATLGGPHDGELNADGSRIYVASENNYQIYDNTDPFDFLGRLESQARLVLVNFLDPVPGETALHHPLPVRDLVRHAAKRQC